MNRQDLTMWARAYGFNDADADFVARFCNVILAEFGKSLAQNFPKPDITQSEEPIAYITGYHEGFAIIEPVDRNVLLPVGMALYRSPTTLVRSVPADDAEEDGE